MQVRRWVCAACLLASPAGCGGASGDEPRGMVEDSAGIRVVTLPSLRAASDRWALSIDPAWDPLPSRELGELLDVEVLPDGRAVLLERYGARVIVVGGGKVQAEFGAPGGGPGEFNPDGLSGVVTTDSSVLIPDLHQQRLTEFALDGTLIGTSVYPGQAMYAVDWRRHPQGGVALRLLDPAGDRILRIRGGTVDTVYAFPLLNDTPNLLLEPIPLWDVQGERMVTATSADYDVRMLEIPAGRTLWIARGDVGPLDFTDSDRAKLEDVLIASAARESRGAEPSPEVRAQILSQVVFPSARPALAGIHLGRDGSVWVREAAEVGEMGREALRVGSAVGYGGANWDVLTPEGLLLARVSLPIGFAVTQVAEEWVYGIVADDLGVQRPARLGVPW